MLACNIQATAIPVAVGIMAARSQKQCHRLPNRGMKSTMQFLYLLIVVNLAAPSRETAARVPPVTSPAALVIMSGDIFLPANMKW